jgi:deoxyribonuclease V
VRLSPAGGPGSAFETAVAEQARLRESWRSAPLQEDLRFVAGADVSSAFRGDLLWAGLVVCDMQDGFRVVDTAVAQFPATFPYIPGLLAFREVPPLLQALRGLRVSPQAILVDAQGTAHPRHFGSACHLGVLSGIPTVGCAKNRLCGIFSPPDARKGSWAPLLVDGETLGAVVRTRAGVAPVFVSPGHLSDLPSSLALVLKCAPRYRIPVPIREAHHLVNTARRCVR